MTSGDEPDALETPLVWSCPLCGKSAIQRESATGTGAQGALRSHVYVSEDERHGPDLSFPDGFDPDGLSEFVTPQNSDGRTRKQ